MTRADPALTDDEFLGGRLRIMQPKIGFRAGTDTVLLAAAVTETPGQSVLELGAGVGTASLCLAHRVGGLDLVALELQADYAALAAKNADANRLALEVVVGDVAKLPQGLRSRSFDHVIANPPYFDIARHAAPADPGRATAHVDDADCLASWVDVALRRLRPGGHMTMINHAERLTELLASLAAKDCGDIMIRPVAGRAGRAAGRIILRCRKSARGALTLLPPVVLHADAAETGAGGLSPWARGVLRDGRALPWAGVESD